MLWEAYFHILRKMDGDGSIMSKHEFFWQSKKAEGNFVHEK